MAAAAKRRLLAQADIDANPEGKRARLQRMMNIGSTSNKALVKILREAGLDVSIDHDTAEVGGARFETLGVKLELPSVRGSPVVWELCDPGLLITRVVRESAALQALFEAALAQKPCSLAQPWRLLAGWDEYVPGNKLKVDNSRKCMNLVFSFVEFGVALHTDVVWFTPFCVRRSLIERVAGGWSAMLRRYLELQMFAPGGLHSEAGVALELSGGKVAQLFAVPHRLLSDGDGLRIGFEWMGSSATKPCWRHWNVLKKGSGLADHKTGYVEITCGDPTLFKAWPDADFCAAIDNLVRARIDVGRGHGTQAELQHKQRAVGFKPTPESVLASIDLRSVIAWQQTLRFDWVHTFLADGAMTTEAWLLIESCQAHGVASQVDVRNFLQEDWRVPRHRRCGGSWRRSVVASHPRPSFMYAR